MEEISYSQVATEKMAQALMEDNGIAAFSIFLLDSAGKATFRWGASPEQKFRMVSWMMEVLTKDIDENKFAIIATTNSMSTTAN